jgi:iron complex outermembrane receptor protein
MGNNSSLFSNIKVVAAVLCVLLTPGLAQGQQADDTVIEEVVVTGTRIQKANLISVSPITQLDAEELRLAGITRVEDLLKNLPQLYSTQNSSATNDASGTATLNMRNLGSKRTLVLVDGKRLSQGSPYTAGVSDINQVPGALIDRIEVLTGGASAVYGSDAMAGVINFFLVDDFEGVKLDYQFSQYNHNNDDGGMQNLVEGAGYPVPSGTYRDGDTHDAALMVGANLGDGRGNLTVYVTYRDIDAVTQDKRDHSACALGRYEGGYFCGGSATIGEGLFTDGGVLSFEQGLPGFDFMVQGDEFVPWDGRRYNYAPQNYFQRPDERWTAGVLGHYALGGKAEAYTQLMYMDDQTVAQVAPSGLFFNTDFLYCGNPLMSQQQFDALCGNYGLGTDDYQVAFVGRRNVEGGPRQQDIEHTAFRGIFGIRGDINDTWRYDLYGQYAEVDLDKTTYNDTLLPHIKRALDVRSDPDTGEPVCRSVLDGSDSACQPWNIFAEGGVTQAALDYISAPISDSGTTDQTIVSGYLAANLADYGIVSPLAETGMDVILGAEYREENLELDPDKHAQTGDVIGIGESVSPLDGGFDVTEFYTELSFPLVEGRPLFESLTLDLGYRYSDYSPGDREDTYKVAGSWVPVDALHIRASYQRAVRAPNVGELFTEGSVGASFQSQDPCAGADPMRSLEDCARSGVTAEQYGAIPVFGNDPNEIEISLNLRGGGNADLGPEKSDTYSVGFVYAPSFIEGLSLSLDWWEIEIDDAIAHVNADTILQGCLDTGEPALCKLVRREPEFGSLWLGDNAYVDVRIQNIGYISTSGYDFILDYSWDAGSWGSVQLHNIMTYLDEWKAQQDPSAAEYDCRGVYGRRCRAMPELRNHMRVIWATPWDISASVLWRHIDDVKSSNALYEDLDSYNYFDVSLLWDFSERASFRIGISNLFDEDPPIALDLPTPWGNGNSMPGVYDALGQYWFAGITVGF